MAAGRLPDRFYTLIDGSSAEGLKTPNNGANESSDPARAKLERRVSRLIEALIALALFTSASLTGATYVATWGDYTHFYQHNYGPAVMVALGEEYSDPDPSNDSEIRAFLEQRIDALDIAAAPSGTSVQKPRARQKNWAYLIYTVGFVWRLFGISWDSLILLHGILYGTMVVIIYGIFRLGMNRALAVTGAIVILLSPASLYYLPNLRDFAKAPFILMCVFLLGLIINSPLRKARLLGLALAYGAVVGVGVGFRADLLICIPPAVIVLTLFLPGKPWQYMRLKLICILSMLAMFFCLSYYPMSEPRGMLYHVMHIGLGDTYEQSLGTGGSTYSVGSQRFDEPNYNRVTSYARRTLGVTDRMPYGGQAYANAGKKYYLDFVKYFPADIMIRWHASVRRILDYAPFVAGKRIKSCSFTAMLLDMRWRYLGWLSGLGIWFGLAAVLSLATLGWRPALGTTFLIAYFAGYPAIQFNQRHFFHLEFVHFWVFLFVIQVLIHGASRLIKYRSSQDKAQVSLSSFSRLCADQFRRPALFSACLFALILVPLWGARLCQYYTVGKLYKDYDEARLEPVDFSATQRGPMTWFTLEEEHADTPPKQKIELNDGDILTDYLVAEFDCRRPLEITFGYKRSNLLKNFPYNSRSLRKNFSYNQTIWPGASNNSKNVKFYFPVYEGPSIWGEITFEGIGIRNVDAGLLKALYRVEHAGRFPFLLHLTRTPGYSSGARFHKYQKHLRLDRQRGSAARRDNLLENGDFENWPRNLAAPPSFNVPQKASVLRKEPARTARGRLAVKQTWDQADSRLSMRHRFSVELKNLKSNTTYELFIKAMVPESNRVRIAMYQKTLAAKGRSRYRLLEPEVIMLDRSIGFREYVGRFTTLDEEDDTVVISTFCRGGKFPISAYWDDFRLTELAW